jgi:hypothetical protein
MDGRSHLWILHYCLTNHTQGVPFLYTLNLSCRQNQWDDLEPLFRVLAGVGIRGAVPGVAESGRACQLHTPWMSLLHCFGTSCSARPRARAGVHRFLPAHADHAGLHRT